MRLKFLDCVTFETAKDLTVQFTLDCSVCCVLKAEAQKDVSYGTLMEKVQEVEPDAKRDTVVKKKINNLPNAFRKEHKKL